MTYEINKETCAIIYKENNQTMIIEEETELYLKEKPLKIIDNSCKYYGSSYLGRYEGSKYILGLSYKSPIIIEENNSVIFFPTNSPRKENCHWISLNNIKDYKKIDTKQTLITFINNKKIVIDVSYNIIENQIFRATRLEAILRKRKR